MSIPITANTVSNTVEVSANRLKLGAPKAVVGRGTYEALDAQGLLVRESGQNLNGKGLRETLAARSKELSSAAILARANALVTQAGLPAGLNKSVDRPTSEVLAVRVQRQEFMRFALK